MVNFAPSRRRLLTKLQRRWIDPIVSFQKIGEAAPLYAEFFRDWRAYSMLSNAEQLRVADAYPRLFEQTSVTPYDRHYFYQSAWAARHIHLVSPARHVDVGSHNLYIAGLSAITNVYFVDYRPVDVHIHNIEAVGGDILKLPFADESVISLSCLHVAEHIGLGRYGDPLNPLGTKQACAELQRVLAPGGYLYFSLPVGRQRVCFNAHRVHSPYQVLAYFDSLQLESFGCVLDNGTYVDKADVEMVGQANYACGLFLFMKNIPKV